MMQLIMVSFLTPWDLNLVVISLSINMLMTSDRAKLYRLKAISKVFATATCLKVNFNKSFIIPVNVDKAKWGQLTNTLGCQLGKCLSPTWGYLLAPRGPLCRNSFLFWQKWRRTWCESQECSPMLVDLFWLLHIFSSLPHLLSVFYEFLWKF